MFRKIKFPYYYAYNFYHNKIIDYYEYHRSIDSFNKQNICMRLLIKDINIIYYIIKWVLQIKCVTKLPKIL